MTTLAPKLLGFWTRYMRETFHWSQEALAELSGLNVRTVQRIEAGERVNITTRRALARGLGYEDRDVFDDPAFIKQLTERLGTAPSSVQKEMLEQQFPDHMRVKADRVKNGDVLGRLVSMSKATAFHADDDIPKQAKRVAASLFDYMSDMADLYHQVSFSERLVIHSELGKLLRELESLGAAVYSAVRTVKTTGENEINKSSLSVTVGYLTIVPLDKNMKEMLVPRRVS